MLWLSICQTSTALDPIAAPSRPWAKVQKFWRFCQQYGEYQATPPSQRRRFVMALEETRRGSKPCPRVTW